MRERPIKSNTIASMKHCLKGDVSLCLRQDKGTRNLLNMSEIIQTLKERGFLKDILTEMSGYNKSGEQNFGWAIPFFA
jgi:hypothetical protein